MDMKKLLKSMMAIVLSLAMVFTVMNYTPANISAASTGNTKSQATSFPRDKETQVGAWYLYQGVEEWAWDGMTYESTGSSLGATKMIIENNRDSDYQDDLVYSLYAKLKNHTKNLIHSVEYTASMNIRATKAGTMIARINDNDYRFNVKAGTNTYTYKFTYNNEKGNDVQFFMGLLKDGTEITISNVSYTSDVNWRKVPNNNDSFTTGKWRLFANYVGFDDQGNDSGFWGSMAYNTANSGETIGDTKMKITGVSGWLDAYSCMAILEGYASLAKYSAYTGTIKINSSKATKSGKKLRVLVDEKKYEFSLSAGDNTLNISKFTFAGQSTDVVFEFDQLEVGTEINISQVTFTKADNWAALGNKEDSTHAYPWVMNQMTDEDEEYYSNRLFYYKAGGQEYDDTSFKVVNTDAGERTLVEDGTTIKLSDYLQGLTTGNTYNASITINTTGTGGSMSVDYGASAHKSMTLSSGSKTYTASFVKKSGNNDLVLNIGKLANNTEFTVTNITITHDSDWAAVPNDNTTFKSGAWYLYANYQGVVDNEDTGLYGSMSYKTTGSTYKDTTVKLDSTSGWMGAYANTMKLEYYLYKKLTKCDTYTFTIKVNTTKATGKDASGNAKKLRVIIGGQSKDYTLSAGDNTLTFAGFKYYSGKNDDIVFALDQLEAGTQFKVTDIAYTKTNAETQIEDHSDYVYLNPWYVKEGEEEWGWADIAYTKTGTGIGDTTFYIDNQGKSDETYADYADDRIYSLQAGFKNYAPMNALEDGVDYTMSVTVETTKAGKIMVNTPYKQDLATLTKGTNVITRKFTHNSSLYQALFFGLGVLPDGTQIKFTNITFTKDSTSDWTPVPNAEEGFTVGPWTLYANYVGMVNGQDSGLWGKMQYKTSGTGLGDTIVKVKSSTQYLESYSVFMKLDGYLSNKLTKYDSYTGTIKVNSSKATASGKKLRVIINGKNYDFSLSAGANTLSIPEFKYDETGKDIIFELDELTQDTEFKVTSIGFTKTNTETQVPENKNTKVDPWVLNVGDWAFNGLGYTNSGTGIGDTTFYVSNSRDKDWDDVEYSITATIPNKLSTLYEQGNYQMALNITSNKAGTLKVKIDETIHDITLSSGTKTYTINFKYQGTGKDYIMYMGLLKDSTVMTVNSLTLTDTDSVSGWTDLKNDTDTKVSPWTLHATYFGMVNGKDSGMWGKMAYKKNASTTNLGDTTVKLKSVSGWLDAYSCFMKLPGYTSQLTEKDTYKVTIKVNSSKATKNDNKLRVIMDWNNYDFSLSAGDNTLTINNFKYLAKDPAGGSDDTLFELDCLQADTEFTVKSITFTKTNSDIQLPRDEETEVGPWTLYEGIKEWAWDSMSYTKTGNNLGDTTMYIHNDRDKDYQDDLVYSLYAKIKNSTINLEDSYRYNLKFTLTSNKAGTIKVKVNNNVYDVAIQSGTHTYTQEFKYNVIDHEEVPEADDLYFYMGILKDDTQINISSVKYEKTNDYIIPPRGKETTVGPWVLYCGVKEWAWNSLAYKTTGNELGNTTFYIENDRDQEYSDDLVYSLYAKLPNNMKDLKPQTNYKMNINITSDKAGLVAFKIDEDIVNLNITAGTKTYEVPFQYKGISKDFMMYLGKIQNQTTMTVNSLTYVDQDAAAGWIDVPNGDDGTAVSPWVLHSNYTDNLEDGLWGMLSYKKTSTGTGIADTTMLVKCASGWADAYAAFAELPNYNKNLVENDQYKGTISLYSSKATTTDSTTGKVNMLRIIIDGKFYTYKLSAGTNTITIPTFKFTGESTNILFELDELEAGTQFKVNSINFTKQNSDIQLPSDKETQVGPWTLYSGPKEWAWDYLSYTKTDNTLGGTTMYIANNRDKEYADDLVYSLYAKLPNYLANLEDTYRYKANIQITSNKAGTIRAKINDQLFDINVSAGTKTYTVQFKYNVIDHELVPAADDVYFYLGCMPDGTVMTIPSVEMVKANDYIIPTRGEEKQVGPWTVYCGIKEWGWNSLAYKTTGNGIADTTFYIENDREEEYSDDLVYSLYAKLANKLSTLSTMNNYKMNIKITSDKAAKFTFKIDAKLYTINIKKGTYTYTQDFRYTGEDSDFVMFLGEVGDATTFNVNSLSFTDQDAATGWTTIANDTDTTVNPWTLHSAYEGMVDGEDSGMWGKLAYKKTASTSNVGDTTILVKSSSGWLEAYSVIGTLKDYNKSLVENDTYKFTIKVNSSKATKDDNKLRIIMDGKMYDFSLSAGANTLTIPALKFTGESTDIVFEFDQLEAETEFKVNSISYTKTNQDIQLPSDKETQVGPWTLYSGPKEWAWDYLSYTKTDNTLGGTTMYIANNREEEYSDDLVYSLYAKLPNYLINLEDSYRYKANIQITSNKAGTVRAKINDNLFDINVSAGTKTYTVEFKYNVIDHELVPAADDVYFYLGCMPDGTVMTIPSVEMVKANDYIIPPRGQEKQVGPWTVYCGIKEWAWDSLAYKTTGNGIADTTFYIENDREEEYSDDLVYSLYAKLTNKLSSLNKMSNYRMSIKITSDKAAKFTFKLDAKLYTINIKKGTYTYTQDFKYTGEDNDFVMFLGEVGNATTFNVNSLSFTDQDAAAGWIDVPNGEDGVAVTPWVLHSNLTDDLDDGMWGKLAYKKNGTGTGVSDTSILVKSASGWADAYAAFAELPDYNKNLVENDKYKGTISLYSSKATGKNSTTGKDNMLRIIIDGKFYTYKLSAGTNTITIPEFKFTGESTNILFELDELEAGTEFKVNSISFAKQNVDTQLPSGVETQIGPWALYSGPKEWAWDYLSYVKNDNTLGGTTMYIANGRTEEYSDDLVYSLYARLPNYLADLEDSYRYKVNIKITSNKAGTIRAKINDHLFDIDVSAGTKTYTVEFKYNVIDHELVPAADDVYFYLGCMPDGTVMTIPSVEMVKANDYIIPPRGQEKQVGPWTVYCGIKEWAWDSLAYKTTGNGIADTQFYIENDREEEYSDDLVYSLYAKLANKLSTLSTMTNYKMAINITSDKAAKFTFKIDAKLYEMDIKKGTYTYNLDFKYTGEDSDFVMFLGKVGNATTFNVNSLSFTDQDVASGWTTIEDDTDTTVDPWTLHSVYVGMKDGEDSGMWGKLAYKKTASTSNVGDTTILVKSSSGWLEAYSAIGTLKDYNKSLVENDTYKFTIKVNSSKATKAGNKLRVIMDGKMYDFSLNAGANTLTIPALKFTGESTNILFELDQLEAGTEFKVNSISHTKTNKDTQLPSGEPTQVGPWTLYSGPKEWAWDYLSYTINDNTLGGTTMYIANNRDKDYQDDLVYSLYAKLTNMLATLEDSYRYKATFTIKSTKAGKMRIKLNDNIYDFNIKAGTFTYTQEFKYNQIDHELVPEADDLIFFMGLMPDQSVVNITGVDFEKSNDYIILPRGEETDLGPCVGYCGIKEWAWNSLAYKATGNDIEDIEFYVENDRTEEYSDDLVYSLWVQLKDRLASLDRNTNYRMNLNITSSKAGTVLLDYDTQQSYIDLKEGTNEYSVEFSNTKMNTDLKIFLGLIKNGTFLRINKVSFTNIDAADGWKKIANGKEAASGPWVLSNTFSDDPNAGQYGQMMYKKTDNTLGGTEMWIKSVSGWYEAYAVTAKLEEYTGDILKYNKKYYATIEIESDKSTSSSGGLRVIIDNNMFDLALKSGTKTYTTKTFTNKFSSQDILFEFDKLYAGTKLKIKSITFTQVDGDEEETTQQTTTKAPTTQASTTQTQTTTKAPTTTAKPTTTVAPTTTKAPTTQTPTTTKAPTTTAKQTTVAPTTTKESTTVAPTTTSSQATTAYVEKPGRVTIDGGLTKKRSAKKLLVNVKPVSGADGYHAAAYAKSADASSNVNAIYENYYEDTTFEMESDELANRTMLYVRIRAYKWNDSVRIFGDWSAKTRVTIEYDE